ncbi:hypothetical protein ACEWGB_01865 [Bifidobacterium longum subsp. infantis]|uniref:hypothetical protein n=1 Tax=Bifidobacterium longum TaxID=216816 RepID=UPI003CFD6920
MTIHNSLAELIGNTPLVKLNHIPQVAGVKSTIAVKVEYFNPGGTISGTGKYLKEASNGAVKVIGSDPEGSIYSASSRDEVHQYDIEGVGEDFYPKAFNRNITDDWMRANGYGDIVERTSKPSLAEQYLDGAPSDEGAGDGLHN